MNSEFYDDDKDTKYTLYGCPDRIDILMCNECHIGVNDFGQLQCSTCFCMYDVEATKQAFIVLHNAINPIEFGLEAWNKEWVQIKKIRRLRRYGHFDRLQVNRYVYKNIEGKVVDYRYYYELRN